MKNMIVCYEYVGCEILIGVWSCKFESDSLVYVPYYYDYDMMISLMLDCDERKFLF